MEFVRLDAGTSDEFNLARYRTLLKQVPFLYVGLIGVTIAIAQAFFPSAPMLLTVVAPAILVLIGLNRLYYWRWIAPGKLDPENLDSELLRVTRVALFMSILYALWTIALSRYGDSNQISFLCFFLFVWTVNSVYSMSAVPVTSFVVIPMMTTVIVSLLISLGEAIYALAGMVFVMTSFMIFTVIRQSYNNLAAMVASQREVNLKREAAERAERLATEMAFRDPLTGLGNRRKFENDIAALLEERSVSREPFGLMLIDLDGFKPVNDVYGHKAGDLVLQEVARRLAQSLGGNGHLARLGGDEFGVLITKSPNEVGADALSAKLCAPLHRPFFLDADHAARISGSCGIALFPDGGETTDELIANADVALYESKNKSRGRATVFCRYLDRAMRRRSHIEQALRAAIVAEDFKLLFQPIVALENLTITSLEALARWIDPELGEISPSEFIPLAEQAGLVDQISDILLRKAASEAVKWPDHILLSFNLSAVQLVKPETGGRILGILEKTGLSPKRLEIELTETALMTDFEAALSTINTLREAGVRTSLDDFGVGYASFAYLHKIAFDRVKVDKSFTSEILSDPKARQIVKAVAELCNGLGMEVVAEGIENRDQLEVLKGLNCGLGQGFYLVRPLAASKVLPLLRDDHALLEALGSDGTVAEPEIPAMAIAS